MIGAVPVFDVLPLDIDRVVEEAAQRRAADWRMIQICASTVEDGVELTYTFIKGIDGECLVVVVPDGATIPSITGQYPIAFVYENEIQDLYGIRVEGLTPDFKGSFYNVSIPAPMNPRASEEGESVASDDASEMQSRPAQPTDGDGRALDGAVTTEGPHGSDSPEAPKRTVIPFGPQHPVLPEPLHLSLELEDERVVAAIPQMGFVHRGLEKLVQLKDYQHFVHVAERICGICSFGHSYGYSQSVEQLMGIEIPPRADFLRVIWNELSRIHSHLMWLGLMADAFGFENLFYQCWSLREVVLNIFERTAGGRVILSVCNVGGVNLDIVDADLRQILDEIMEMQVEYRKITRAFLDDVTVRSRLVGVGILPKEDAIRLGCVGPFARASGVAIDVRAHGIGAYASIEGFEPVTTDDCDGFGRVWVRIEEVNQSIDIIRELVSKIPQGPVSVKVKPSEKPEAGSRALVRIEQPRGEALYLTKGNGTKFLDRFRVRTPTSQNLAGLLKILEGCDLADVPINILTIDPCISCTER